jgi:hypothetical protein
MQRVCKKNGLIGPPQFLVILTKGRNLELIKPSICILYFWLFLYIVTVPDKHKKKYTLKMILLDYSCILIYFPTLLK